jgi:hypothetical protein
VDDLCQAAVDFEDQRRGFNEVLDHFQKMLLGNLGSPYFAVCLISCFDYDALFVPAIQQHWSRGRWIPPHACALSHTP